MPYYEDGVKYETGHANIQEAGIMLPVDIQSHYAQTVQLYNAVNVPLSGSVSSAWIDTNGFDRLATTVLISGVTSSTIQFVWSNDGVAQHGVENALADVNGFKVAETTVKARYVRLFFLNGDATNARTMSAWFYLKA